LCGGFAPSCEPAADCVEQQQFRLLYRRLRNRIRIDRSERPGEQFDRASLCLLLGHVPSFAARPR
jgi:hypothetical protein